VLVGFKDIEIIDLDTIDVSNLNRQFLFRPCNVGQPKSLVASDIARKFNPEVKIKPHHGNVKDPKFGITYFKKFDLVLNALDNVEARKHVNRLCLAAGKPLIDSGTTGYNGQVMPILKGRTACYECIPKPTQKVYPICTIRATPDKPVHCIVWAKELFKLLFGKTEDSMLFESADIGDEDEGSASGAAEGVSTTPAGPSAYMHVTKVAEFCGAHAPGASARPLLLSAISELLTGLFNVDVARRIEMDVYKTAKAVPVVVPKDVIVGATERCHSLVAAALAQDRFAGETEVVMALYDCIRENRSYLTAFGVAGLDTEGEWDHQVLPLEAAVLDAVFTLYVIGSIACPHVVSDSHLGALRSMFPVGVMEFDKDDNFAMRFVSVATNLRSGIFHIPRVHLHESKGIAGNIIPAITATNAIVSGAQVLQAINVLSAGAENARAPHVYCNRSCTKRGLYLCPYDPDPPSSSCYVCSKSQIILSIDVTVTTLKEFVIHVLKGKLGFNEPNITVDGSGLYEEGDDAEESLADNLVLILDKCPGGGIVDGTLVTVDDFSQDLTVEIIVEHRARADFDEEKEPLGFVIGGKKPEPAVTAEPDVVSEPVSAAEGEGLKRKREDEDDEIVCL
jgi:ubiquitin-like 1-activating enzyme E1 B